MKAVWTIVGLGISLAACGGPAAESVDGNGVSMRNLAATEVAGEARAGYVLDGDLMPTPSDTRSKYFLLRQRTTPSGTRVAVIRQEQGDRIAYVRAEVDCGRRLFHVLGVGDSRGEAEATIAYDGPLRPVAGLPLRAEMASYVCDKGGTPLTAA